jgi:hypothetical protein
MPHTDTPDLFLRLTVPSDPRFVETVGELAGVIAERTCGTREGAAELQRAVDWTTTQAMTASAGDSRGIEVWFEQRAGALDIRMRFADVHRTVSGGADSADDTPRGWDRLSPWADRVDVIRNDDLVVCRMSCRLPHS